MLDIESKKYRVRSAIGGGYTIENKKTGEMKTVKEIPHPSHLAAITESEFDRQIGQIFEAN